jgi:hypothetical protein
MSIIFFFLQKRQRKVKGVQKLRRFKESSYMDPNQSLCLGALFNIAATNVNTYCCLSSYHAFISFSMLYRLKSQGLDLGRRLCIFGFCRSVEMLSDVVEDTVLEHGGEVC